MNDTFETDKPIKLLRIDQVLELIPVSKSTWWAGVKSGRFPKPIKLPPNITAWKEDDIHRFIQKHCDA